MASIFFLISLFSCDSEPSKKEKILEALKEEPHKAKELALQLENPIERTQIITEIVENYPHRTRILCEVLPSKISQERCFRINQRPHLWKEQRDHLNITPTAAITPLKEDCSLDPNINTCRTAQALKFAQNGDSDSALQACAALEETLWQSECFFTISEELSLKPDTYEKAISACDYAKQFAKSCWHHSVMGLASQAPEHWNDWSWHAQRIALISEVWKTRDQEFKTDLHSHFWAQSIRRHVEAERLDWENIPQEAKPHARAALTMQLIRKADYPLKDMEEWLSLARKAIEKAPEQSYPSRIKPRGFDPEIDLWKKESIPEGCSVISYLGNSHRISCEADDIDWQISFLEASARLRPTDLGLIGSSAQSKHPAVKQTAIRLKSMDVTASPDQQTGRE